MVTREVRMDIVMLHREELSKWQIAKRLGIRSGSLCRPARALQVVVWDGQIPFLPFSRQDDLVQVKITVIRKILTQHRPDNKHRRNDEDLDYQR